VHKYDPLSPILHALADPTRRTVVERLAQGNATVGQLAAAFDMALPSFVQHLAVLEAAGLVTSTKSGRVRTYTLEPQALRALEQWVHTQNNIWEQRLNQFDAYALSLKENL
jgi:DNA-binding transcriptional ArsR family regulator